MKHNEIVVDAFFKSYGIPIPERELVFHPTRKWRFDYAWEDTAAMNLSITNTSGERIRCAGGVALECQGGIFIQGRHSRGAALLKEWEKLNTAAEMNWRIIYCQPSELLTKKTADTIRKCLGLK